MDGEALRVEIDERKRPSSSSTTRASTAAATRSPAPTSSSTNARISSGRPPARAARKANSGRVTAVIQPKAGGEGKTPKK